jgi:hypothetical protein
MDRKAAKPKLVQAQAFVEAGRQRIACQRMAIDRRSARGLKIVLDVELLVQMVDAQRILVAYRDRLRDQIEERLADSWRQ